jgi:serine/threonine protein kinase
VVASPREAPAPGAVLGGRYRLDARIAAGGLGTIYRAHDLRVDLEVAVKVMTPPAGLPDDPSRRSELVDMRREAQAAMALTHPFILRTFTWDRFDPWEVLVMEYVEGESLHDRARRGEDGRMAADEAAAFTIDILTGLQYAHACGVLHNDLKPRNVIVAPGDQVKICDFGIASRRGVPTEHTTSSIVGTIAFMSPERLRGEPHDARSDVYSVGATLYTLVAGKAPFGSGGLGTIDAHLTRPVPPSPHVDGALLAIIHTAMAKRPEDRYASADAMRAALLKAGFVSKLGGSGATRRPRRGVVRAQAR